MILNTGNRTDIPAYYSEWFYRRVQEGYVLARSPYAPQQVIRYRLTPDIVDCLCFCTKNPAPMLSRLSELDEFHQYWHVTITPYGRDVEPHVPDKEQVMDAFCRLSEHVGIQGMSWRYDPIFLTKDYPLEYHLEQFAHMVKRLRGFTDNCVISFIDLYAKTVRNFPEAREVEKADRERIYKAFVAIGDQNGIRIRTCCEGTEGAAFGVDTSGCMPREVLERAIGCSLEIPRSVKPAREGCACLLGNDIGAYNTCGHGCLYCYANYDREIVERNMRLHDPKSPFLIGGLRDGDVIREAKQELYGSGQMSLFV